MNDEWPIQLENLINDIYLLSYNEDAGEKIRSLLEKMLKIIEDAL